MDNKIKNIKKLNLGCGIIKLKGFINIDILKECNPDMVIDFNKAKLPFADDSIEYIYSYHCLEHLNPLQLENFLIELYRISKHGCIWEFHTPYYNSTTMCIIGHFNQFGFRTFNFVKHYKDDRYTTHKIKGELLSVVGIPTPLCRFIPRGLRDRLSVFIGNILIGMEYKIKIIKWKKKK